MKAYFQLQHKILNRKIIAFGMPVLVAYIILPIAFILLSIYLFSKTEYAAYIYCLPALSLISNLNESDRSDFLNSIMNKKNFIKTRMVENIICALPFILFLIYKGQLVIAPLLLISSIGIVFLKINTKLNYTIPSPFSKHPFEFTVGFRKTVYIIPIAYVLAIIAISVDNFNLGIFSMLLITIISLSYYSIPENEYIVWSYNLSASAFLFNKFKICLLHFSVLICPILLALCIFFSSKIAIILVFFIVCYLYLITLILAKYAAFPNEMNLPQGIILAIALLFPPALIGVIPLFYSMSIKKLNTLL